ncbi:hypothetical protein BC830DRAFT_574636 [Chytriomyces sp. MP71]|nr:hypothetical protein BC830DRAFT_574636 [Chytriomyces sp. MP71]
MSHHGHKSDLLRCGGSGCERWLWSGTDAELGGPVTLACGNSVCSTCAGQCMREASAAAATVAIADDAGVNILDAASAFNGRAGSGDLDGNGGAVGPTSIRFANTRPPALFRCPCSQEKCPRGFHAWRSTPGAGPTATTNLSATLAHDVVLSRLLAAIRAVMDTQQSQGLLFNSPAHLDVDALRADTECALCCALFVQPISTPCGHAYCRACIISACEKCGPVCPVCRSPIPPPSYFHRRPVNKVLALIADWLADCTAVQHKQSTSSVGSQATVSSRSAPLLQTSASSPSPNLGSSTPTNSATTPYSLISYFLNQCTIPRPPSLFQFRLQPPPPAPKVTLKPNQYVIPVFLGSIAVLPGIPCYMQLFEQRYKDMIQKIMRINRTRGNFAESEGDGHGNSCDVGLMYGVCVVDDEATAIYKRECAAAAAAAGFKRGRETVAPAACSSSSSSCSSAGASMLPRGLPSTSVLKSVLNPSNDYLTPWIVPSIKPGYTSVYLEYGTALKLRSINPVYVGPHGEIVAPPNEAEDPNDASSDEDDLTSDEEAVSSTDDEGGESGSPRREFNEAARRRRQSARRRRSGGLQQPPLIPQTPQTPPSSVPTQPPQPPQPQYQEPPGAPPPQAIFQEPPGPPPPMRVELSRFFVDGVGSWRFKVIERAVCEDGLNIALVEHVEDLDIEDEVPCMYGLAAIVADTHTEVSKKTNMSGEKSPKMPSIDNCGSEVCNVPGCDCSKSRSARERKENMEVEGSIPSFPVAKAQSARKNSFASAIDIDSVYTCPSDEFFKNTKLSCLARTVSSGAQSFTCSKQPPFPFDLTRAVLPSGCKNSTIRRASLQLQQIQYLPCTARLYGQVRKMLDKVLYLILSRCGQVGASPATPEQEASFRHFKLIHGSVPSSPVLLSYWLANLLNVPERAKYELLRDDVGGVVGRFEFFLGVVERGRREVRMMRMREGLVAAETMTAVSGKDERAIDEDLLALRRVLRFKV